MRAAFLVYTGHILECKLDCLASVRPSIGCQVTPRYSDLLVVLRGTFIGAFLVGWHKEIFDK